MSIDSVPSYLVRPLIILCILGWWFCFYLYSTWAFTEEKLVEKIAKHRDEPLADLHSPWKNELPLVEKLHQSVQEKKEDLWPVSSPPDMNPRTLTEQTPSTSH